MMSGRPPVRPTGPWGTSGVETASPVSPGAGVLRMAIRVVPLSSAPPGPLESAVVPVFLGPRASGWDCGVVLVCTVCLWVCSLWSLQDPALRVPL
jgi:hypothetical protein